MSSTVELVHHEHRVRLLRRLPWQDKASAILAEPSTRWLMLCMGRQAGKTTWLADVLGEYALKHPGSHQLVAAPSFDLVQVDQERFRAFWQPALRQFWDSKREGLFWNDSRVLFRSAHRAGSLIARQYDRVFFDEAARVSDLAVNQSVTPTIGIRQGTVIGVTTPAGRRGWFYDRAMRALAGDEARYRLLSGPSSENPAAAQLVEDCRATMPDLLFRQEILAEFIEDAGQIFRAVRERATSALAEPQPGRRYIVGCDLGKHQDFTVLCAMDSESGEVGPLDRFWRLDWGQIVDRVETFRRRWNKAALFIDSTGVGDPIYDRLRQKGIPVQGVKFTHASKAHLVIGLAMAIDRGEISYPEDEGLLTELQSFTYEQTKTGFTYCAPAGLHDDRVIALALAVYGRSNQVGAGWMQYLKSFSEQAGQPPPRQV